MIDKIEGIPIISLGCGDDDDGDDENLVCGCFNYEGMHAGDKLIISTHF